MNQDYSPLDDGFLYTARAIELLSMTHLGRLALADRPSDWPMTFPEKWRPTVGWEGYEVSNHGRVRRVKPWRGTRLYQPLKLWRDSTGYHRAILWVRGKEYRRRVHQLVAGAFIGPCPAGHVINHIDGCRTNNRIWNLEYVTPARNAKHAFETGLYQSLKGSRNGASKLTETKVLQIKRLLAKGQSAASIGRKYGVSDVTVCWIRSGKLWRHVN